MEKEIIIERFGGLLKEEPLSCVNDESIIPNTCVLEAVNPFFGYYRDIEKSARPSYFYIMLEGNYSTEQLIRTTVSVRKRFSYPFDATPGFISIFDQYHRTIRLRDITQFSHLGLLQKLYSDEGLVLYKKVKLFSNENARISLNKMFFIEPVGELMFIDKSQNHHGYFIIPRHLEWAEFKDLTKEAKYDTSLLFFDAATAFFYENNGITEMVRIYKENLTVEKLSSIRLRYYSLLG